MSKQERTKQERAKLWINHPYLSIKETSSFERTSEFLERVVIHLLSLKADSKGLKESKPEIDAQVQIDRHNELRELLRAEGFHVIDPEQGRSI